MLQGVGRALLKKLLSANARTELLGIKRKEGQGSTTLRIRKSRFTFKATLNRDETANIGNRSVRCLAVASR